MPITPINMVAKITFASTITAGEQTTFTVTKAVNAETVTIVVTANGTTDTVVTKSSSTSINYTFPFSLFDTSWYWKESSMEATVTITTYLLNRRIGMNTYTVTIYAPVAPPIKNSLSATFGYASNPPGTDYVNAETLTGKYYNNGLSNVTISYNITPQNSRIYQVYMTGDFGYHLLYDSSTEPVIGGDGTISRNTAVRNLYGKTGENTFTITAVDLRGQQTSQTFTQTLYVATAPTLTNIAYQRGSMVNAQFVPSSEGTVIQITGTLSSETTFGIITVSKDGTEVSSSQYASGSVTILVTSVDPTVNTELQLDVHNWLANSSYTLTAPISKPDFNYNPTLHAIGIGKQAGTAKALELGSDWSFKHGSDTMLDFVIDQGFDSTTKWRWRKWKSGFGELWLTLTTITPTTSTNENGQYYSENLYVYPPFMVDSWSLTGITNNYSYICNPGWSNTNGRYSFRIGRAEPIATGTAHNLCLYICGEIV